MVAVALLSGCGADAEPSAEGGLAAPASQVASAPEDAPSVAPTQDAATKKACKDLLAAITDNAKKVAEAEKIGPPAGHIAVGAQYIAGAADLTAKSIGATDPAVVDAAGKVGDEMKALDEAYQENPKKKPSKADLNKSVTALKAACTAK